MWLTTWQDTPGIRHHALAKKVRDAYFVDVFTPCEGFIDEVLDNTGTEMTVTCLFCLHSAFVYQCGMMNLDAIEDLDEGSLFDHFADNSALAVTFSEEM